MHKDEVHHSEKYKRSNDAQDNQQGIPENKKKLRVYIQGTNVQDVQCII